MWYRQHINPLLRRIDTVQTTKKPPSFTWCPAFYPMLLGTELSMSWNTLISPLKKWSEGGQACPAAGTGVCHFLKHLAKTENLLLMWGEIKAQELINVGEVAYFVPGEGGWRACVLSILIPSFFRAEIPINTHDMRWGLSFLPFYLFSQQFSLHLEP